MKAIIGKRRFLAAALLVLALGLTFLVPATVAQAVDPCNMTVKLPGELQTAGATVNIRYGASGLGDGDTFAVTDGSNFQWTLTVNGFTSGYKTAPGVCDGDLEVTAGDWCEMEIVIPPGCPSDGVGCGNAGDCLADIEVAIRHSSFGWMGNGATVILPQCIDIQWQLRVNGFTSGYTTKHVDCTPLEVNPEEDLCCMHIEIPDGCPAAGVGCCDANACKDPIEVAIRHSDFGWMKDCDCVCLPQGINIQWQIRVNGFTSGYKTKPVDCSPLVVNPEEDLCCMHISVPSELANAGGQVDIRYSSFGWMDNCSCVCLPQGINIQWKLKVNGFESGYKSKPVDCQPLAVTGGDYKTLTFKFGWTSDWKNHKTEIRYGPVVDNGATIILPQGINIQVRPKVYGNAMGGYHTKNNDCSWDTLTWELIGRTNAGGPG